MYTIQLSARSTVLTANPSDNLGNLAQNTRNINATGSADFSSFFNKFNYFRKVNEVMSKRKAEIDSS